MSRNAVGEVVRGDLDYLLVVLLLGDCGVGKTAVVSRYTNDTFNPKYENTIGVDFAIKTVRVLDCTCKLQIWDTAGHERFRTITRAHYRGARGFILVYDVSDIKSFENLKYWLEQIREYADASRLDIVVAANKCDDSRVAVSAQEGEEFARSNGCAFFEVSAKTGSNIDAMFTCLAELMVRRVTEPQGSQRRPGGVRLPMAGEIRRRPSRCC